MHHLTVETGDAFASLLELAANNDVDAFKSWVERDPSSIDQAGAWYGRQKGSKQIVMEERTPLMVAATYGSTDVLKHILSLPEVDVNRACGLNKSTALHCAASGGSSNATDVVKMLLATGADPYLTDGNGHRPVDVIPVGPKFGEQKLSLEKLLSAGEVSTAASSSYNDASVGEVELTVSTAASNSNNDASVGEVELTVSTAVSNSSTNTNSPPLSPPPGNDSPSYHSSTSSPKIGDPPISSTSEKKEDLVDPSLPDINDDLPISSASEKKEYPVDPSLPDINGGIYSTDEFRMYAFKVRPCSRAYSHDWTECPFVHPGENARRRDPRKYHYSSAPCPEFRKGSCRRGDMCEYSHGVFECWLHPAQYRTRLCKDGMNCNRRVCFFAHTPEELRPLYVSTGSAVPSPRSGSSSTNTMDFAPINFLPASPSSVSVMSPSPFTAPISSSNVGWTQHNAPALHLPGVNLQSSRLRSSVNARDISSEDLSILRDIEVQKQQLRDQISCLSQLNINASSLNRAVRSKTVTPSNLEDLFSSEGLSPRHTDQTLANAVFSPPSKSAIMNQFHQPSMISPINTSFSPKGVDHALFPASLGAASSGRMSPRNMDPISPLGSRVSMLAQREQLSQQVQQFRSLSSRELGSSSAAVRGSPVDSWTNWGSSVGKPDWAIDSDANKLKRSSSFELGNDEPDLSWVQLLVRESPQEIKEESTDYVSGFARGPGSSAESANVDPQVDQNDPSASTAMLDQMQF